MNGFFDQFLSFREGSSAASMETVLLCVLVSFLLGTLIAWLYMWTHRGVSYSPAMAQSLIVLSMIVTFVMLVVGNSLARAFGLFGALALIRFRTPVKDVRDTVFLFASVGVGIAVGTQSFVAAAAGTLAICLVLGYLHVVRFGTKAVHNALLRFRCPAGGEAESMATDAFGRFCDGFSLMHVREAGPEQSMEFAYQLRLFDTDHGPRLMSELGRIEGVSDLSLLMQDSEDQP